MAQKMNASFLGTYDQKQVRAYTDLYNDAVKLMKSEDLKAFDVASEPDAMKDLYGRSAFGQGCLFAVDLLRTRFVTSKLTEAVGIRTQTTLKLWQTIVQI